MLENIKCTVHEEVYKNYITFIQYKNFKVVSSTMVHIFTIFKRNYRPEGTWVFKYDRQTDTCKYNDGTS